jgi:hypothetical protein
LEIATLQAIYDRLLIKESHLASHGDIDGEAALRDFREEVLMRMTLELSRQIDFAAQPITHKVHNSVDEAGLGMVEILNADGTISVVIAEAV